MRARLIVVLLFTAVAAVCGTPHEPGIPRLDCASFDPSRIRLVTFDVFAALMDVYSSLHESVPAILKPAGVSEADAVAFADKMVSAYGKYAGHAFTEAATDGQEPFEYVARKSIAAIAAEMNVDAPAGGQVFGRLLRSWGNLTPWTGTAEVLQALQPHFQLAPLSNGDANTLTQAVSVFYPAVNMSYVFSSNFPVGAFKPQPAMYRQLLDRSRLAPDEILHVAGAPGDGKGARDFGLFSALLHNAPLPGVQPCFPLANITLLPAVLGL